MLINTLIFVAVFTAFNLIFSLVWRLRFGVSPFGDTIPRKLVMVFIIDLVVLVILIGAATAYETARVMFNAILGKISAH